MGLRLNVAYGVGAADGSMRSRDGGDLLAMTLTETSPSLAAAVDHLRAGGVVAIATETFFSLCADARRASAIEAVFALKGREEARACAVILPSVESWSGLVREVSPRARALADRFWPGPLTITLPARDEVHPLLRYRGKVAARVPGASPALDLVRAFGSPLTATSANVSGAPSALSEEDVRSYFAGRGNLMIVANDANGRASGGMPSTVVELGDDAVPEGWRMLRAGAIPASVIESVVDAG